MSVERFEAVAHSDPAGSGIYIEIPRRITDAWRAAGVKGAPKVRARFEGAAYRGSLMPVGGGVFCLGILKSIQAEIGRGPGDRITVELELDTEPRTVDPPPDLKAALDASPAANAAWEQLSYTNRKEIARSLEEAKKPETRARRLAQALARLTAQ